VTSRGGSGRRFERATAGVGVVDGGFAVIFGVVVGDGGDALRSWYSFAVAVGHGEGAVVGGALGGGPGPAVGIGHGYAVCPLDEVIGDRCSVLCVVGGNHKV
jgi:hypothetical protein